MTIKGQTILRFSGLLLFVAAVHAQGVFGSIDFFGYKRIDLQPVKAAVPVHAGDPFRKSEREAVRTRIKAAIRMLNSGTWSDRNKSAALLEVLSKSRQPELMAKLRADALDSLIEMAKWNNPGHAYFSRAILGRIAGIEEVRLKTILDGDWSQILKLL